jgi:gliding motility associated protien GldN
MTSYLSIRAVRYAGCLGGLLLAANLAFAQKPVPAAESTPLDDITTRSVVSEHKVLAYQPLREADIFWEKRIWRIIDTREKINLPFVAPESPLMTILTDAALKGDLTLYSTEDDRFTKPLTFDDLLKTLYRKDTILNIDVETGEEKVQIVQSEYNWEQVKRFRVKESWYFDTRTGSLQVKILGIAPMIDVTDNEGNFRFEKPMFWVYYPQARETLARHKVVTPGGNFASTLSWEDWFETRHFSSMVTKENNTLDLRLQDQTSGLDLVMQAKAIQDDIFNREHDVWSY